MKHALKTTSPSASKRTRHVWWMVAFGVVALVVWIAQKRIERVDHLSELPSWSVEMPVVDPESKTGYEDGQRRLIVPGQHHPSYGWIMQAQLALAEGKWRIRQVDYDNAPEGRDTHATSPYRWYLTSLAWLDHLIADRSVYLSVEYAARYADPLLQLALVVGIAVFAFRRFGVVASCLATFSGIALFPLGGNFQAGAPDHHALVWLCTVWSILPLLAAVTTPPSQELRRSAGRNRWFIVAGVASGLGMWIDSASQAPITVGIVLGGIGYLFLNPRNGDRPMLDQLSWRAWAIAGAVTSLIGYVVEYVPSQMEWKIHSIHALHALAFLGLGELLMSVQHWRSRGRSYWRLGSIVVAVLALMAVAAAPVVSWLTESGAGVAGDPFASELANHPEGTFASNVAAWVGRDGFNRTVWAVTLPVAILVWALVLIAAPSVGRERKAILALVAAPALVALGFALAQLRWWNLFDVTLIPVAVALFRSAPEQAKTELNPPLRWLGTAGYLLVVLPGFLLSTRVSLDEARDLNEVEVQASLERDLAYWLVKQSDEERPGVFTTPALSEALQFYGGIRGIASHSWENEAGFSAAMRIASASTWTESHALLTGRNVSYVVLASWDPSAENLIRLARKTPPGAPTPTDTMVGAVTQWNLAPWMRPVPYNIPKAPGFEGFASIVISMQAEQEDALTASRLADYFLELGMMREAAVIREQLALFPRDLAALTMQAQINLTLRDAQGFNEALETLLPHLTRRSARSLPLDRRVSLAALLVQAKRMDEAREQMRLVAAQLDSERIRELTTSALVRVLAMSKMLDVELKDPELRGQLIDFIPPSIQAKLETGE